MEPYPEATSLSAFGPRAIVARNTASMESLLNLSSPRRFAIGRDEVIQRYKEDDKRNPPSRVSAIINVK